MRLNELLSKADYQVKKGSIEIEISTLVFDSRKIIEGSVFVCMVGARLDGHDYIEKAVDMGAKAIVVEREVEFLYDNITLIYTPNARKTLAEMSAAYFDYPALKLKTIGITGTKGKTTTAYMVHSILEKAGLRTGLIGTIETIIGDKLIPANNTTPESYYVQEYFHQMVLAGCDCVVMEVSSQGLMLYRVGGFTFDFGIFTNLEPDHIGPGEHKDLEDYIACKAKLFSQCKVGILNADASHLEEILLGHTCLVETYGLNENANLRATNVDLHNQDGNLLVTYEVKGLLDFSVQVNIPGTFSVYNSLTAIAICRHFNVPAEKIKEALLSVKVKGRVEPITISKHFTLMIDYAHNAMSLDSVLSTLREYNPKRLVCMFGCGGNRSRDRRYEMGEISSNKADFTVVTSDNPRDEKPEAILRDILIGVKKGPGEYIAIIDRKEAIRYCILNAQEGDVILLAGKGHEDYQEICGHKYHMDERELIQEVLAEMTEEERKKLI